MAEGDEEQYDRVAQLRESQQRGRIADERAAQEEAEQLQAGGALSSPGSISSVFGIPRDELNDNIARTTVKPEPIMFFLVGFPFLSLQEWWGKMITKGRSRFISEPSFRPWIPFLPKEGMDGLIVSGWLFIFFLIVPSLIFDAVLLYLIGKAMTDPIGAANDAKLLFGAFGCTLVQWLGFPGVLC